MSQKILDETFAIWLQVRVELKRELEIERERELEELRLKNATGSASANALGFLDRASRQQEEAIMQLVFSGWTGVYMLARTQREFQARVDDKRSVLQGLHGVFRDFAVNLEGTFRQ